MRTAHITLQPIGDVQADYIFGTSNDDDGHFYNVGNGIHMHFALEEAMDKTQFMIGPACPDATESMVVAIDPIPNREHCTAFTTPLSLHYSYYTTLTILPLLHRAYCLSKMGGNSQGSLLPTH
jgi:hypothetical protein